MLHDDDHRALGHRLGLFHFQEEAAGSVFWHPRGLQLLRRPRGSPPAHRPPPGLPRGPESPGPRPASLGTEWPLERLPRGDAGRRGRGPGAEAGQLSRAHELVRRLGPLWSELPLRRRRVRPRPPRRAVGSAARPVPPPSILAGRRARLLPRGPGRDEFAGSSGACGRCTQRLGFEELEVAFSGRPRSRRRRRRLGPGRGAARRRGARCGVSWSHQPGEGAFYGPKLEFALRDGWDAPGSAGRSSSTWSCPSDSSSGSPWRRWPAPSGRPPPGAGGEPRALPGHPPRAPPGSPPRLARSGAGGGGERRGRWRPRPECAPGAGGGRSARPARRPGRRAVEEGGRCAPARRSVPGCGRSARRGQGSRSPPGGERRAARFPLASLGDELSRLCAPPASG